MKHTHGPWIAIPGAFRWHSEQKPLFDDGLWHILPEWNQERLPLCEVDHADDHHGPARLQAEYDARLIAAAPELLEALESIENDAGVIPDAIWQLRNKAIAKAKGR